MTYKYPYTRENGYHRIHLSRKDHNELFPYRKLGWWNNYHILHNGHKIVMENHANIFGTILAFVLLPVAVIYHGFANWKDIWEDTLSTIPSIAKKKGSFSADEIGKWEKLYNEVLSRRK